MKNITRVKLFIKDNKKAIKFGEIVKEKLLNNNIKIDDKEYDLIISIGGDGTFLKMIHKEKFNNDIYYLGINAGSLGFLTSFSVKEIDKFFELLNNGLIEKEIPVLKATVITNDGEKNYLSINEFTIRKKDFSTLRCDVYINNQILEKFSGDGLVISTKTGSTGYNLALGGPIIDNDLNAFILTPIAPIINKVYKSISNPVIIANDKKLVFKIDASNISVLSDGIIENINHVQKIIIELSSKKLIRLVPKYHKDINIIKSKIVDFDENERKDY